MDSFSSSKKRMLTLAVLCAVGGSLPVMAAPADGDVVRTKDVIVTATRTEEEVKVVPQNVEVITSEDIEKLGATDVYQALKLASNVDVTRAGMAGHNVMIRGMSTNHTLILVNGMRRAGEDTSVTQNVYALDRLSLSDIERIEIVRGPASAQYGSDALGGVINIITKKSGVEPSVTVGASTGTSSINNYYHINFGKQGNFSGSLDMRFSKLRKQMFEDSDGSNYYGPTQDFHFDGNFDLGRNQNLNVNLGYYHEQTSADYVDATGEIPMVGIPYVSSKDKKEWYDFTRKDFSLAWTGKTSKNDWMIRTYYSYLDKDNNLYNHRPLLGALESMVSGTAPRYDWDKSKYKLFGIEGKDTMAIGEDHLLTFGAEYRTNKVEGTRMGDGGDNVHSEDRWGNGVQRSKYYSEKDVDTYAVYIQDEWMVNDKLLIIPSIRYDHDSSFGGETTPKIGATYFLNDHNRFKANWGKGFKAPTISELYMNMHRAMGPFTVNVYGNPDLQPEETESWDISYEYDDEKTWGKITYFENDIKNLITSESINGSPFDARYVNVNRAEINGVELEIGHHFNKHWTVKATSNWLDAVDKADDSRLENRAKNITTLQLMYDDLDPYGYSVVLWNQWVNKYRHAVGDTGSSMMGTSELADATYSTLNLTVNKKFGKGNRIFAGCDNIFDEKNTNAYLYGRTWVAGAEWTF
ncbi:TonB-dependent receptor plug domain-containing protein [Megasphaera stantonii]|uniref:TonB-dependent receptor plug domain-containing protein n=1 Tax=Megasphaera stantonii TaxID=2144175 RepID=UPI00195E6FCB|nr:TonB-dependent receptor [Megasphaera stantonii]MBM6732856.1 TonB-dependent receptor [Megasphaera stantonii]